MGRILEDGDNGIHCEVFNWGVTIFDDFGKNSLELDWPEAEELKKLLDEAIKYRDRKDKNVPIPESPTKES